MDFYGFSNGVEQANALNFGSALANNSYNSINTGLLGSYNAKKVKKDQVGIDTDQMNVNMANKQTLTDEITQGGGTVVGIGGVGAVGKGIRDAGNQLGKAKRIAEQHLKLATASGDSSEISKAQSLLDVTDKGDLKGFVRLTGQFANQRSVTKALGTNIDRAVGLATDINAGSSFGPAAASVSTSVGRTANSQIVSRAAEIAEQSTPEVASSIAGGNIARATTPATTTTSLTSRATGGGRAAYEERAAARAARRAFVQEGGAVEDMAADVFGTAGRPDTRRQTNVAEIEEGNDYTDADDELRGFETQADNVLARGDGVESAATGTSNVVSNLGARTGGNALRTGTESFGSRGIASTIRRAIGGQLDLETEGGLQDVDESGAAVGELGAGWLQNIAGGGIRDRGLGSRQFEGIAGSTQSAPAAAPAAAAPEAPDVAEAPEAAEALAPTLAVEERAVEPAVESVAERASVPAVERVAGAATNAGNATAATLLGSSEHAEAIAGGGIDEVGIKAVSSLGGFSGAVGGAALKTVSAIGKIAKVAGPIASAGFLIDQTYEEVKAANPFGKTHSLEGTGGWEKGGNILKEIGDGAATIGGALALAGPATLGLSDVAALGVELGGGALALAGDLMDDYGKAKQDKAAKASAGNKLIADKAQAAKDATASNQAVQSAVGAGNRNLSGRGSIAQVSSSAIRSY